MGPTLFYLNLIGEALFEDNGLSKFMTIDFDKLYKKRIEFQTNPIHNSAFDSNIKTNVYLFQNNLTIKLAKKYGFLNTILKIDVLEPTILNVPGKEASLMRAAFDIFKERFNNYYKAMVKNKLLGIVLLLDGSQTKIISSLSLEYFMDESPLDYIFNYSETEILDGQIDLRNDIYESSATISSKSDQSYQSYIYRQNSSISKKTLTELMSLPDDKKKLLAIKLSEIIESFIIQNDLQKYFFKYLQEVIDELYFEILKPLPVPRTTDLQMTFY